jgi:hypothetical protein
MTRRIMAAVTRALFADPGEPVHFHQGPEGHPAVCYDANCPNPRLEV